MCVHRALHRDFTSDSCSKAVKELSKRKGTSLGFGSPLLAPLPLPRLPVCLSQSLSQLVSPEVLLTCVLT